MAVTLPSFSDKLEVVIERDSALEMTPEEYQAYVDSKFNKSLLKTKPDQQPTVFVLRKVLPFELACKVQNEQLKVTENGKMNFQMSVMLAEIRAALCDIVNPPGVPADQAIKFVQAEDGGANEDLVAVLHSAGIVQELYLAYKSIVKSEESSLLKKK